MIHAGYALRIYTVNDRARAEHLKALGVAAHIYRPARRSVRPIGQPSFKGPGRTRWQTIPTTMAAVQLIGHGGFDKLLYREDVPVPSPGPDDVLINVTAAGVNNTDINTRTAWYSKAVTGATGSRR